MALRDQPYLPLYVQDYLTDEKLNMCSPATQGIYIKIMCVFHKSDTYGGILLKQKDKQNESTCLNFALKLARLLPFNLPDINNAITELLDENVLQIDGDLLFQKRMVRDNEISEKRANAGKIGGIKTQINNKKQPKKFAKAKTQANTENENENENESIDKHSLVFDEFRKMYPGTKRGNKTEFDNFKKKHSDWASVLKIIKDKLSDQINARQLKSDLGQFVPEWKNLQTWINQRCWEDEITVQSNNNNRNYGKTTNTYIGGSRAINQDESLFCGVQH